MSKSKPSQKARILELLRERQGRGATSREIARDLEILNHTARMNELRADGHVIPSTRMPVKDVVVFRYVLVFDADKGEQNALFDVGPQKAETMSAVSGRNAA